MENKKSFIVYKKICAAIVLFTFCGICGWVYETVLTSYVLGHFSDRGILYLPVLPIYGVFSFLMIPVFRKHNSWLTVFLGGTLITTLLELISSYIIEWILHYNLWSYSSWDFNFEGRISLYSSLVFGVMSVILIKLVYPLVKKMYRMKSSWIVCSIGTVFAIALVFDFVHTMFFSKA